MKSFLCLILAVPFCVCAVNFVVDARNNETVEVTRQGAMLKVVCRFPARTKFEQAINAQLNDQESQQLFLKGLIRYFKAGPNGTMVVSGKRVLGVRTDGDYMVYTFAVPKSGCKVVPKPKPITPKPVTNVLNRVASAASPSNGVVSVASPSNLVVSVASSSNLVASVASSSNLVVSVPTLSNRDLSLASITNRSAAEMCEAMMKDARNRMTNMVLQTSEKVTNGEKR